MVLRSTTERPEGVAAGAARLVAGIAELGFDAAGRHLAATLELLGSCPCQDGCPSCVQSPKCGNGNDPLDKAGAYAAQGEGRRFILRIVGSETNVIGLPMEETLAMLRAAGLALPRP